MSDRPTIKVRRTTKEEEEIDLSDLSDDMWQKLLVEALKDAEANLQYWGEYIVIYNGWEEGKFRVSLKELAMGVLETYNDFRHNPGDLKSYLRDTKKTLKALKKSVSMLEKIVEFGGETLERLKKTKKQRKQV